MAAAAGLALLDPQQPEPMSANTRGVGELILTALDAGAAGGLGEGTNYLDKIGITDVYTLCRDSITMEDAIPNAAEHLRETAALATRTFCGQPHSVQR